VNLRQALFVLTVAATTAFPAAARADEPGMEIALDLGNAIIQRDIVIKTMNYCYQHVAQDNAYIEARNAWYIRNGADIILLNDVIAKIGGFPDADRQRMDGATDQKVANDMAIQPDKPAYCKQFADTLNGGASRDLSVGFRSSIFFQHLRDWLKKQP
jgi:hypothetical protein